MKLDKDFGGGRILFAVPECAPLTKTGGLYLVTPPSIATARLSA